MEIKGKIIKGIAGFYYVHTREEGIIECKAKGIFRKDNIKPLVGDDVTIELLDAREKTGNLVKIHKRRNQLLRPTVANVDQAMIIFAIVKPAPNFNLLDKFLIMMEKQELSSIICFNKQDIATEEEKLKLKKTYEKCGYQVVFVSALEQDGTGEIQRLLTGKTTAIAGPSGVGKSTLVNGFQHNIQMETGEISRKIERGKHTTRHTQLIAVDADTYIMDTPGFSSLKAADMEKEEVRFFYPEFAPYEEACKFHGCTHIHEPSCGVKQAVEAGEISDIRYENYKLIYEEVKAQKKY